MTVYVLRHGIAEPRQPRLADEKRALTRDGAAKLRKVLECARAAGVEPALVLTSPYRRAVETAEIAVKVLGGPRDIVRTEALAPSSSPEAVWDEIRTQHAGKDCVLLAGHEPLLGHTIAYLLGAAPPVIDFKKGALARIEVEQLEQKPRGLLQWLLTPKLAAARPR